MTTIQAVSIDWEGCITEPGGGRVAWPTQKIADFGNFLWELQRRTYILPFINSGRGASYIEAGLQALGLVTTTPHVVENGSLLYIPLTGQWWLNPAITKDAMKDFRALQDSLFDYATNVGATIELGKDFSCSFNPPPGMIIKEFFGKMKDQIITYRGSADIVSITHSVSAVDVTIKGVTKASGLAMWQDRTKVPVEEIAAIGDSRGDLPVLEEVGFAMCPANATDEVKNFIQENGGYISPYRTTLGVVDCLRQVTEDRDIRMLADAVLAKWVLSRPVKRS